MHATLQLSDLPPTSVQLQLCDTIEILLLLLLLLLVLLLNTYHFGKWLTDQERDV